MPMAPGGLQQNLPGGPPACASHGTLVALTHTMRVSVSGWRCSRSDMEAGAQSIDEEHLSDTCCSPRLNGAAGTHTDVLPQSPSASLMSSSSPVVQ